MGDPSGVGPELCLRLLAHRGTAKRCTPIVFGNAAILNRVGDEIGLEPPSRVIARADWPYLHAEIDAPAVLDIRTPGLEDVQPATISTECGRAAWAYINESISAALAGEVDAVSTAPINKAALAKADIPFAGHTEIFAEKAGASRSCMMQYSEEVTVSFVTCHVGLRDVPALVTEERVFDVIELSCEALSSFPDRPQRIVVCGLNPHAGEGGLFGAQEEELAITPAIERARLAGIEVEGPVPPDVAFLPKRRKKTGCTVCMYHDQGHIPLKALAFDRAVNMTLGLPIIRTSVDHGTAFDIAWKGKADPSSLRHAVRLAARLAGEKYGKSS